MVERRDLLPNADRWLFDGLSRLVQMVRVDPAMTDYYLHGSSKLDVAMRKHVCISGIAAYVAESATAHMLEDGRLARTIDQLKVVVQEEFDSIAAMDDFVRGCVAQVVQDREYGAAHLRSDCIHCAHVQRAFLQKRVFSEVESLP